METLHLGDEHVVGALKHITNRHLIRLNIAEFMTRELVTGFYLNAFIACQAVEMP